MTTPRRRSLATAPCGGALRERLRYRPATPRLGTRQGDFAEFVTDTVAALGYKRVETSKLRAAKFGASSGVRMDLSAKTENGLDMKGTAEIATANGKLYLVLYIAPAEHYYAATLPEVESVLASAT